MDSNDPLLSDSFDRIPDQSISAAEPPTVSDWSDEDRAVRKGYGGKTLLAKLKPGHSTSATIKKLGK